MSIMSKISEELHGWQQRAEAAEKALAEARKAIRAAQHRPGCAAIARYLQGPCDCYLRGHEATIDAAKEGK